MDLMIDNMEQIQPIKRREIIGKCIRCIFLRDSDYNGEKDYQGREIIIELESGLRFMLDSETDLIDPKTGFGFIYPYTNTEGLYCEIDARSDTNLSSPVKTMIKAYGYPNVCGVVLENRYIVIKGFALDGDELDFCNPGSETMAMMEPFDLPD